GRGDQGSQHQTGSGEERHHERRELMRALPDLRCATSLVVSEHSTAIQDPRARADPGGRIAQRASRPNVGLKEATISSRGRNSSLLSGSGLWPPWDPPTPRCVPSYLSSLPRWRR